MAFGDAGTEDDGPVKFDGFSSTSSEDETPKQRRKQQRQQQKQQNGIFSIPGKRKGHKISTVESSSLPPPSFQNSSSGRRRSSSQQEHSSRTLPPLSITTTSRSSNKRKRSGGTPFTSGSSNNHNHHQHSRRHVASRHHEQQHQHTDSHRSPKRANRTTNTSLDASVARLPPPPPPPQAYHHHHLLQESDDTTTSTRHLQTNNTTTTEITSNVHLKRRAVSANLSICSDTAEYRLPHHPVRNQFLNANNDPHYQQQRLGNLINRHQSDPAGRRQSFFVDENTPYLSLIEGIQDGVDAPVEKYVTRVLEGRQVDHPKIGRMIEVPFEAVLGAWTADISPCFYPTLDGNNVNPADHKRYFRIHLRHHSHQNLGSLKSLKMKHGNKSTTQQHVMQNGMDKMDGSSSANKSSPSANKHNSDLPSDHMHAKTAHATNATTTTTGNDSAFSHLAVSALHPSFHRSSLVKHQQIVDLGKPKDSFVGSISVVSFEGFTSGYDQACGSREISGDLLKQVEKKKQQYDTFPYLLGIQSSTSNKRTIGISAMCGFSLDQHYNVLIAQDVTLEERPVVAMDIDFWMSSDPPSSPNSSTGLLSELSNDNADDDDGPFLLTEENLKAHTSAYRSTAYSPIERLFGGNRANNRNTSAHPAINSNKLPLDNLMTGNHMDIIPRSPRNDDNNKFRPSSPKKSPKKKRRIRIRNTKSILARAKEKAAGKQSDDNKNNQTEQHPIDHRHQFSKGQASNHRILVPYVPYSPPIAWTSTTVPHFGQTNMQERTNSHSNNRYQAFHKNDYNGEDEEFDESDPTNHEAGDEEEVDDRALVITKHKDNCHRHHQRQEKAAILMPRVSSPLQQHTPLPQLQQQNGFASKLFTKDPPPLPLSSLDSPLGVGNMEKMAVAASSVPGSDHWKAYSGNMVNSITAQREAVEGASMPPNLYNPQKNDLQECTPHISGPSLQEDLQQPVRAETSNLPPSLPTISNTRNHNHAISNSPMEKSIAAATHSNLKDGYSFGSGGDDDTKDEDTHIKTRDTLEEDLDTAKRHHLQKKRFRVQGHRCFRPKPYSTSMVFLAAVTMLLFFTFPKNYNFQLPISTTNTTQRTASIRSRHRRFRQKNMDMQFPPTYSVL